MTFVITQRAFMAKLVRHLTSNEEIVSSNLAEGNVTYFFVSMRCRFYHQSHWYWPWLRVRVDYAAGRWPI